MDNIFDLKDTSDLPHVMLKERKSFISYEKKVLGVAREYKLAFTITEMKIFLFRKFNLKFANRTSLGPTLSQLTKKGNLIRISKGIYKFKGEK